MLKATFPQTDLLVSLVYTISATTAAVERSFSALKRIKSYSRHSIGEKWLSLLAIISIEFQLLEEMRHKSYFFEEVVADFAS